jgi:very-short-patch-repair endonuclease
VRVYRVASSAETPMTEFHSIIPDKLLYRGRTLRRESTFPERKLWQTIRGEQLCGLKFRRQHAIGPFTVDFYCHEHRLVIELDGNSHIDQAKHDRQREEYLANERLTVLRFQNDDVLSDIESVLKAILVICQIDPLTGATLFENIKPSP